VAKSSAKVVTGGNRLQSPWDRHSWHGSVAAAAHTGALAGRHWARTEYPVARPAMHHHSVSTPPTPSYGPIRALDGVRAPGLAWVLLLSKTTDEQSGSARMSVRWTRWAPLTGVVFAILFAVSYSVNNSGPSSNASGASLVTYYVDHKNAQNASAYGLAAAAVFAVLFGAVMYSRLRPSSKSGGLTAVGFGGAVMIAVGLLLLAGMTIAITDVPAAISPAAVQALNVATDVYQYPLEVGVFLFTAGYGIAIVCGNVLPRWLGWVAIVLAVASAASVIGPVQFFGGFLTLVWFAVVSVWLVVREWSSSAPTAPVSQAP